MTFSEVVTRLEAALARALPGATAHDRLAPVPRRKWPAAFEPARIREAAGLLLVFPKTTTLNAEHAEIAEKNDSLRATLRSTVGDAHIVLTVRGHALGRHSGQVSLPGGVVEPGETFEQAGAA